MFMFSTTFVVVWRNSEVNIVSQLLKTINEF
jgi:hypothetical protein